MNPDDPSLTELCELGPADYAEILELWTRAGLPVRPAGRDAPDAFARQLASGQQRAIGLRADGRLVGVAVLTHDGRKGWVNRLAIDSGHRRRGIARRLIAEAERWFTQDLGLEVWAALIESKNDESLALFDALGFRRHDIVYVSRRARPEA